MRNKRTVLTHSEATELFNTARDKEAGKPLYANTRLVKRGENYAIRLHYTDVVTICKNGTYVLRSGGWQTNTTKARINQYSPVGIYQEKFVWYLVDGTEFYDGITV